MEIWLNSGMWFYRTMHYRKTLNTRSLEHFLNGCSRQTDSSKQDEMERKCTSESTTGLWVHQISQVPPPLEISSSDSCSKSHWRLKLLFLLCGQWLDLVQDSVATGMLHSQSKVILRKHILPMKLLSVFSNLKSFHPGHSSLLLPHLSECFL